MSSHESHATAGHDDYQQFKSLLNQLEQHGQQAHTLSAQAAAAPGADPIGQICRFWPTLRTVLQIVLHLPFIPGNVKTVIQQAITFFNGICPGAQPAAAGGGAGGGD
jgi:hypothetical protein